MVSSSGTGHTGPDKNYVAYGSLLQHYTGWNSVSGYPGREPIKGGLWADPWVGLELAIVAVAALTHRTDTGRGQYIDFSMAEALSASIPSALLDFQMNRKVPEPMGNRDDRLAPHGVFQCKGTDRWVAIAVTSDEEWCALCRLIEKPDLAENPAYATAESRQAHEDQLSSMITDWTLELEDYQAMKLLQDAGIPSGPSLDIGRVFDDPQLRSGDYFTRLQTSDGEQRDLPGLPWRFDGALQPKQAAAPVLGQHNEYVYHELLGLSKPELRRLEEEQILY
jgi:benzylsuccinate CoA-transferase BbsF subunit